MKPLVAGRAGRTGASPQVGSGARTYLPEALRRIFDLITRTGFILVFGVHRAYKLYVPNRYCAETYR